MKGATFKGLPIELRYRGGLVDTAGNPAHAATYIRKRLIILDSELKGKNFGHQRVLIHEIFHFAWVRLGNPRRAAWERLLGREWLASAKGEAGWSAEWRKHALRQRDMMERQTAWRDYCCESFCDTAAWIWSGDKSEVTLPALWCGKRRSWFRKEFAAGWIAI